MERSDWLVLSCDWLVLSCDWPILSCDWPILSQSAAVSSDPSAVLSPSGFSALAVAEYGKSLQILYPRLKLASARIITPNGDFGG